MNRIPDPLPPVSETDFGIFITNLRKRLDVPLRRFCAEHALDPGNYSKVERGLRPAPKDPRNRAALAESLGLKAGQEEWQKFMDLADLSVGQVPQDLMGDDEIASKLPLVFRSLRGDPLSEEQLRELAELIRSSERAEPNASDDTLFRKGGHPPNG